MHGKYFGTDGIRGRSNIGLITPENMLKLSAAVSVACNLIKKNGAKATVVIGKDTRLSGYMLEFALTSGFISMGVNVVLVGPVPTPAVSMLVKALRGGLGLMISASHNPYYDNGIKFFDSHGYKISKELEEKIEQLMQIDLSKYAAHYNDLGKATKMEDARGRYIEYVKYSFPQEYKLDGIKIVIDCANGAAYDPAPKVFHELGAEVIACSVSPNGFNINDNCGVSDLSNLANMVVENKADIGIALDGDADRVIIVDELGNVIDGDQTLAALAEYLISSQSSSQCKTVVSTIMSNSGLEKYLKQIGLSLVRTDVGDKNVTKKMHEIGATLGGEKSGHIIIGENQATGDGIKAALQILAMYQQSNQKPISKLLNKFTPTAQFTSNQSYSLEEYALIDQHKLQQITQKYQEKYPDTRIILRKSGTEPIIRLMIETDEPDMAKSMILKINEDIDKSINSIK